jgi:hypothetical protein
MTRSQVRLSGLEERSGQVVFIAMECSHSQARPNYREYYLNIRVAQTIWPGTISAGTFAPENPKIMMERL